MSFLTVKNLFGVLDLNVITVDYLYKQRSFDAMTVALTVATDGKFLIGKLQKFPSVV